MLMLGKAAANASAATVAKLLQRLDTDGDGGTTLARPPPLTTRAVPALLAWHWRAQATE